MAASRTNSEANTVLIVFLILFVLTTIGLGISTYTGYAAEDNKQATIEQEQAKTKVVEYERDWYKYCALLFLNYTGELQGEQMAEEVKEFGILNDKFVLTRNDAGQLFGKGNLPDPKMTEQPKVLPKATVERLLNKLDVIFPYKNEPLKIDRNLSQAIHDEKDTWKNEQAKVLAAKVARDKAEADLAKALAEGQAKEKAYQEAREKMQADVTRELTKYQNQFKELTERNTLLTKQLNETNERFGKELDKVNKEKDDLVKATADLNKQLADREKERLAKEAERQSTESSRKVPTDIRLVQVDSGGTLGYINVGSADHVTTQLTFSVFGITPDGRVDTNNKATVEVVSVVGEHLSQVRVTGQRARRLDGTIAVLSPTELVSGRDKVLEPIAKNDVVYNAAWHPAIKRHVAVAGIVDLNGDQRNAMADFIRFLEKQNMVIDAYIDLRNQEIHGKLSVQTDYLIIGGGADMVIDDPKQRDAKDKLTSKINELREQAKVNGVEVVNLKRFLDVIGYRLSSSSMGSLSGNYRIPLGTDAAGAGDAPMEIKPGKKEEKKDDKPAADPKP